MIDDRHVAQPIPNHGLHRRRRHGGGVSRRDTRLNRDVAVKVLPRDFVADADRLRRFEQEAKTLAALDHPNGAADCNRHVAAAREASLPATSLDGMIKP